MNAPSSCAETPVRAVFPLIASSGPFVTAHEKALGVRRKATELLVDVCQSYSYVLVGSQYERCLRELAQGPMADSFLFGLHFSRRAHGSDRFIARRFVDTWRDAVSDVLRRVGPRPATEGLETAAKAGRRLLLAAADPLSTDGPVTRDGTVRKRRCGTSRIERAA